MKASGFIALGFATVLLASHVSAAPNADDVMKQQMKKAAAEKKNIFLGFDAPW